MKMIQDSDSVDAVNELMRKIRVKEKQLKIAQESQMVYVAKAIERQILELKRELSTPREAEPEFYALMSLLDD